MEDQSIITLYLDQKDQKKINSYPVKFNRPLLMIVPWIQVNHNCSNMWPHLTELSKKCYVCFKPWSEPNQALLNIRSTIEDRT